MTGRIASQAPFILLPRYGEKYEGMAKQIKDVIGVARQQARTPEELAFAEYVASNTVGARMGRAINKRQVAIHNGRNLMLHDQYFGSGSTIDPFFLPYKAGFDRTMSDYLGSGILPYRGDRVERDFGIDYQDRLASIAHIPKMMERWENLPKIQGDVYRGNNRNFPWTEPNLTIPRLTSSSQKELIAEGFAADGGQKVRITSKTGRRLAAKDNEEEVLFAPNTMFTRIANVEPQASRKYFEDTGGRLDYYAETGSLPIPKIPSYDELKQMSSKYKETVGVRNELGDIKNEMRSLANHYPNELNTQLAKIKQAYSNFGNINVKEAKELIRASKNMMNSIYENQPVSGSYPLMDLDYSGIPF